MFRRLAALAALALAPVPSAAQDFDYYLLALSWSPTWCASDASRADAEQCDPRRGLGFVLHGLWPQYEEGGWPEYCHAPGADPSRRDTRAMADIMGSGGLAWHQWRKHGRCTGLSHRDYFALSRRAYDALALPEPVDEATSRDLVSAFVAANPALGPEDLVVVCRARRVQEVRVCLTTGLEPRACSREVRDDACRDRGPLDAPPAP